MLAESEEATTMPWLSTKENWPVRPRRSSATSWVKGESGPMSASKTKAPRTVPPVPRSGIR